MNIKSEAIFLIKFFIILSVNLKANIDGKKEVLTLQQKQQGKAVILNGLSVATNVYQYCISESVLSNFWKTTQHCITAAYAVLTVANGMLYQISAVELEKLRKIRNEIQVLENLIEGIMEAIHETEEWIESNEQNVN